MCCQSVLELKTIISHKFELFDGKDRRLRIEHDTLGLRQPCKSRFGMQLMYQQNAWNSVWCSDKCGTACYRCYIKRFMCWLRVIHRQFSLLVGPNDVVCYDVIYLAVMCCNQSSFLMVWQMSYRYINWCIDNLSLSEHSSWCLVRQRAFKCNPRMQKCHLG